VSFLDTAIPVSTKICMGERNPMMKAMSEKNLISRECEIWNKLA
jgi:hypothetical protein